MSSDQSGNGTNHESESSPFADEYTEVTNADQARELLSEVGPDETMLEIDESDHISIDYGRSYVRAFEGHEGEYQIRLWLGGAPIWDETDEVAERLVDCEVALVDHRSMMEV